ncbi:hypothetical protein VPNG_06359 [Cytospora leucostoma]|uniref:Uncharacterized protein n=1 Tax=Cytospora leucostoma TaxID=1230097 RepID=A0A423X2C8_9PEZI|nr:hypothetical protein VPNG_06359 [Cytospora leucostoma]
MESGSSPQPPNSPDTAVQQRATGSPHTLPIQLKRVAELALAQAALLQGQGHRSPEEKAEATHQPESPREPANGHNDDISDHPLDDDLGSAQAPINLEDRDEGVELIYFKRAGENPYIPMPRVKDVSVLIPSVDKILPSWPKPAVNNLLDSFKTEFEEQNAGRVRSLWLCGDDYQKLIDSDPVGLACQLWPDADDKELRMATDLVIWATSWNILLKTSGPMYHHAFKSRIDWFKLRVDMAAESVWVSYGDEVDRPDLTDESLDCYDARKVIDRVFSFMNDVYGQESLVVMDSFADAVCAYMDATGAATRLWAKGEVLTPDDYREKCMGRGHISPLVMLPPVKGYAWDPYSSDSYDELLHQATRIIRLTNDIFSVKEDMAMGNISSSVIVRFLHTKDITDALLDACRELKTARESFEETVLEIAQNRKDNTLTQRFRIKADYLRRVCVGNWMWREEGFISDACRPLRNNPVEEPKHDGAQHLQSRALKDTMRENPAAYDMREIGSFTDFPKHRPDAATAPRRKSFESFDMREVNRFLASPGPDTATAPKCNIPAARDEREAEAVPTFVPHNPNTATAPKRKLSAAQDEHEAETVPAFTRPRLNAASAPENEVWTTKKEHHETWTVLKQGETGTVKETHELRTSEVTSKRAPPGSPAIGQMGYGEQQLQVDQQQGMAQGNFRNTPVPQMHLGQNMGNLGGGLSPQPVKQHRQGPVGGAPRVKKLPKRSRWTPRDENILIAHFLDGKGPTEIAKAMDKKVKRIANKLQQLRADEKLPSVRKPAS